MSREKSMYKAIDNGDLHSLKKCMEHLSKDEARDLTTLTNERGLTPLALACLCGPVEVVEYLIDECGADALTGAMRIGRHGTSVSDITPLWWASARGHRDVVKSLLSRGAKVESALEHIALHVAWFDGDLEMARYLIANGSDNQAVDVDETCLSMAGQANHYKLAYYLMQKDVDIVRSAVETESLYDTSCKFFWMMTNGKSADFKVLMAVFALAVCDIEAKVKCGAKIDMFEDEPILDLISYISRIQPEMSEEQNKSFGEAVRRYVGFDRGGPDSSTPLQSVCSLDGYEALERCSYPVVDMVRLLLDAGADPQAVDHGLNTPLHMVAWARPIKLDVIQLLLDHGVHFDARNSKGEYFRDILYPEDIDELNPEDRDLLNSFKYTTLQCLAARSLKKNNIQYQDQLPKSLVNFVKLH